MSTKEAKQMDQALFDFYGKPSIGQALPLAIQLVIRQVMIVFTQQLENFLQEKLQNKT